MDASIRHEFRLSEHEYECLLATLRARFGGGDVTDLALLTAEQVEGVTDDWERAAVRRLRDIVAAQVGVEKLWRAAEAGDAGWRVCAEPVVGR